MWICLNDSFLSIVAHRTKPDHLLVRARVKEHIDKVFPGAKVYSAVGADYAFRTDVSRAKVMEVLAKRVGEVKYDNFKNSVKDDDLHEAYAGFWSIMYRYQLDHLRYGKTAAWNKIKKFVPKAVKVVKSLKT